MNRSHRSEWGLPLFFTLIGFIFWANVPGLHAGLFERTGLPEAIIPLHMIANGIEGTGWFLVAWLSWTCRWRIAAWFACFLAGMWCWDMMTTAYLPHMPVPPFQWFWGPASVVLMVVAANRLWRRPSIAF